MNIKLTSLCATILTATSLWLSAADPTSAAKAASPEFERMKTLVGTWKGKTDMGQGPVEFTIQYRLIAAGSVVEERSFPGTPNEMVTMYYDKEGKLALTHYCMLGNRPEMQLKASTADTLVFDFNCACGIKTETETHMHALTLRFVDANTIASKCKSMVEGKAAPEHETTLKRVATETAAN